MKAYLKLGDLYGWGCFPGEPSVESPVLSDSVRLDKECRFSLFQDGKEDTFPPHTWYI